MTRPTEEVELVDRLVRWGLNDCEIGRWTGIPRGTIRDWRRAGRATSVVSTKSVCPRCDGQPLDEGAYVYLLGIYLGDGCISNAPRHVFKLRIALDARYKRLNEGVLAAVRLVRPTGKVNFLTKYFRGEPSYIEIYSNWKHWPCLFPQHGKGRKHERNIELREWQLELVAKHPEELVKGLIHSDGCRSFNYVNGKGYPRYHFTNSSEQIRGIFCYGLSLLDVNWRRMTWRTVSVARRADVARLDEFIGPKT